MKTMIDDTSPFQQNNIMKKFKPFIVLCSVILLMFVKQSVAQTGKAPDAIAVKRGLDLYTNNCVVCHQKDGIGEVIPWGIRNPKYLAAMPLNESSHAWHHGDEQLIQMIRKGNQRMPPFEKSLSTSELRDVVAYIKSLWSNKIVACQGPKHMSCM